MSKKTNAEKQARKRQRKPRRKRVNPAFTVPKEWTGGPPVDVGDMSKTLGPMIDAVLGMMFVSALRQTGLRDRVLEVLFKDRPEPDGEIKDLPVQ